MIRKAIGILFAVAFAAYAPSALAFPGVTNVVETGGDNEATDTIQAKWTGTSFNVSVTNEPFPGAVIGNPYSVGLFGHNAPTFVDRNHRYADIPLNADPLFSPIALPIPPYLVGGEYIMSGNDNRDNNSYRLDVTIGAPAVSAAVFMLIDNRLGPTGDTDNTDGPSLGPGKMQWILDQGWIPVQSGHNRFLDPNRPDEVGIDEGADGTVNQVFSVYFKSIDSPGTFSLFQADNGGQNMYGVVVVPNLIPEPGTFVLAAMALGAVAFGVRTRNKKCRQ